MKYIENNSTNPYYNLALEEYVLKNKTDDSYFLLWQNDNTIVVGRHQNTAEEINHEVVEEKKINVVRRETGGGAVYHDDGNLNFSFVTELADPSLLSMAEFTEPVAKALNKLGVNVYLSGRNDLMIEDRKISGNAQTVFKGRVLHHGTLLFNANLKTASEALKVNPAKFSSKSVKSVRSRIGNIFDFLPEDKKMSAAEFKNFFLEEFKPEVVSLTDEEIETIKALAATKYSTWDWVYGKAPEFDMNTEKYFTGGLIKVSLNVKGGLIEKIQFSGDFMALYPAENVANALLSCPFNLSAVKERLEKIDLVPYFGGITLDEILSCIF